MQQLLVGRTTTDAKHAKLLQQLSDFLGELGAPRTPFAATPSDIVQFLLSRDVGGRTIVHKPSCPSLAFAGRGIPPVCSCPLRNLGLTQPWSQDAQRGNPVNSAEVKRFEKLNLREQAASGVVTLQAPLFDESVFIHFIRAGLQQWNSLMAAKKWKKAALLARDLVFYAVLWYTGLRGGDALRILTQQVDFNAPTGNSDNPWGISLRIAVTKTKWDPRTVAIHGWLYPQTGLTVTPSTDCLKCATRSAKRTHLWRPGHCSGICPRARRFRWRGAQL